jgi:hypothetical protein
LTVICGGDLILPEGYGPGQRDEFEDVVVLGALVIEAGQA